MLKIMLRRKKSPKIHSFQPRYYRTKANCYNAFIPGYSYPKQWFVTVLPCDAVEDTQAYHIKTTLPCVYKGLCLISSLLVILPLLACKYDVILGINVSPPLIYVFFKWIRKKVNSSRCQYFVLFIPSCLDTPHFPSVSCSRTAEAGRSPVFGGYVQRHYEQECAFPRTHLNSVNPRVLTHIIASFLQFASWEPVGWIWPTICLNCHAASWTKQKPEFKCL